jgi:hypothetical protein
MLLERGRELAGEIDHAPVTALGCDSESVVAAGRLKAPEQCINVAGWVVLDAS